MDAERLLTYQELPEELQDVRKRRWSELIPNKDEENCVKRQGQDVLPCES